MRLPGAVSRLAAPFFGSQAEPSSRQRGMFGPMVVSVWRLVKHISYVCCVVVVWPMHGVILIFARVCEVSSPFTPHRCGGELHLFDGITHVAELH